MSGTQETFVPQNVKAVLKRAIDDFAPAFKSTWPYTFIGLLSGCLLLALDHHIYENVHPGSPRPVLSLLLEHIGMGLIVSAVAVFFYEWGAHHKKIIDHSRRLADIQFQLMELARARGMHAINLALHTLVPGDQAALLRRDIADIAEGISKLQHKEVWASQGYIECLSEFVGLAKNNVYSLSSIDTPGDHRYSLADGLSADKILAVQMRELQGGDFYDVISHLESWTDKRLDKLQEESGRALSRGVRIRRIFNLIRDFSALDESTVRSILNKHLAFSNSRHGYDVKVLLRRDLGSAPNLVRKHVEGAQIALFQHDKGTVRVKITRVDLSELFLATAYAEVKAEKQLFDDIWEIAETLTQDLIEECVELGIR